MADSATSRGVTLERVLAVMGAVAVAAAVFAGSYRLMSRPAELETPAAALAPLDIGTSPEPAPGPTVRRSMFRAPASLSRPEEAPAAAETDAVVPRRGPFVPLLGGVPYLGAIPPVVTMLPPPAGEASSAPVGAAAEAPPSKAAPKPPDVAVAITATVQGRDGLKALVENKATGETRWVVAGGEAFGYRVSQITPRGAMVAKGDRAYVLPVGAGKAVPAPATEPEKSDGTGEKSNGTEGRATGPGSAAKTPPPPSP